MSSFTNLRAFPFLLSSWHDYKEAEATMKNNGDIDIILEFVSRLPWAFQGRSLKAEPLDMEKGIARAKALAHIQRLCEQVRVQVAWMEQALDFEIESLSDAHDSLEAAGTILESDLKTHLEIYSLKIASAT